MAVRGRGVGGQACRAGEARPAAGHGAHGPVTIAVLLDRAAGYDELKDAQAIGACAQNILLAAHALGLGACWIGRARDREIEALLGAREVEELMMLLPLGYPAETPPGRERRPLSELVRRI